MSDDRLIEVRMQGLRPLGDVTLPIGGLTVLIGENGAGKSSIVEGLELVRRLPDRDFYTRLHGEHGGPIGTLRHKCSRLSLGVGARVGDAALWYGLGLDDTGHGKYRIAHEHLYQGSAAGFEALWRRTDAPDIPAQNKLGIERVVPDLTVLAALGTRAPADPIQRLIDLIRSVDVHLPFDVTPGWATTQGRERSPLRSPLLLSPAERLERFGANLVDVYQQLVAEGSESWQTTLDWVRLGLGPEVNNVFAHTVAAGHAMLVLDHRALGRVPAFNLSDGTLAYLAFVAMLRRGQGRGLLAVDEPELHFSPSLVARAITLFEQAALEYPIVLATQSDALLDSLSDPASSALVAELGDEWDTRLLRLDAARLVRWVEGYRGIGDLRARGALDESIGGPTKSDAPFDPGTGSPVVATLPGAASG